jgi:hypothetical protein
MEGKVVLANATTHCKDPKEILSQFLSLVALQPCSLAALQPWRVSELSFFFTSYNY